MDCLRPVMDCRQRSDGLQAEVRRYAGRSRPSSGAGKLMGSVTTSGHQIDGADRPGDSRAAISLR